MTDENFDAAVFPDITPSKITRSMFSVVEQNDIQTEQDFKALVQRMFEYPDRHFYYFQEKAGARNELMLAKERLGHILMNETEFFYYRHPNFKRDYLKIEVHDVNTNGIGKERL